MKEIAWVFGNSASGKETFIRYVNEKNDSVICAKLGWANKEVCESPASIKYIGQYQDDPVTKKREDILTEVPNLLEEADVVLIKWQTVDSEAERIERLVELLPNVRHRIILINTSHEELALRLPNKSWWDDDDVHAFIQEEDAYTQQWIKKLGGKLEIINISGNPNDNYIVA